MGEYHRPVMLAEAMEAMAVKASGIYIDATLGGGGYSEAILSASPEAIVFGFDTDPEAWRFASERLRKFGERFILVKENFAKLKDAICELPLLSKEGDSKFPLLFKEGDSTPPLLFKEGDSKLPLLFKKGDSKLPLLFKEGAGGWLDGIVYDLGVSSHQLDTTTVGLSYRVDAPLDMRLDPRLQISAKEIITEYDETKLKEVFRKYGEEPYARPIARKIVQARTALAREGRKIESTTELAAIIAKGIREDKKNETLSRIFQALRIEVNQELENLSTSLEQAVDLLREGGRIVVVSYHSLEDRIVKEFFKKESAPEFDSESVEALKQRVDISSARLKLLTKKPLTPSMEEIEWNPRARSAKLRAAVRTSNR